MTAFCRLNPKAVSPPPFHERPWRPDTAISASSISSAHDSCVSDFVRIVISRWAEAALPPMSPPTDFIKSVGGGNALPIFSHAIETSKKANWISCGRLFNRTAERRPLATQPLDLLLPRPSNRRGRAIDYIMFRSVQATGRSQGPPRARRVESRRSGRPRP